jgi:hypothetical protein
VDVGILHTVGELTTSVAHHTSAYVSIRQHTSAYGWTCGRWHPAYCRRAHHIRCTPYQPPHSTRVHRPAYVSIRQHTSAYVSIRPAYGSIRPAYVSPLVARESTDLHTSAYVSIRPAHLSIRLAYVSIRPAYVSTRTSGCIEIFRAFLRSKWASNSSAFGLSASLSACLNCIRPNSSAEVSIGQHRSA